MELEHPADQLIHGCKYDIVIEDDVFSNHTNQSFRYEIPGRKFYIQLCFHVLVYSLFSRIQ